MSTHGHGLRKFPGGKLEQRYREERRAVIVECWRSAKRELDSEGRELSVLALPDLYDYEPVGTLPTEPEGAQ